jgi:hypothetical protein
LLNCNHRVARWCMVLMSPLWIAQNSLDMKNPFKSRAFRTILFNLKSGIQAVWPGLHFVVFVTGGLVIFSIFALPFRRPTHYIHLNSEILKASAEDDAGRNQFRDGTVSRQVQHFIPKTTRCGGGHSLLYIRASIRRIITNTAWLLFCW